MMKKIPDKSIDLVLTDPPYQINYRSNSRQVRPRFDYMNNDKDAMGLISESLKEMYRVLKSDTAIYLFCSWHKVDFFKREFEKHFELKNLLIWNKDNHGAGDLVGSYAPKHELILFGHKGRSVLRGGRMPDVLNFPKVSSSKLLHPAEKPTGLLQVLIQNSSDEGDLVLDPFVGSGATAIAALNTNRNYIGIEIDPRYVSIARNRTEDCGWQLQLPMQRLEGLDDRNTSPKLFPNENSTRKIKN